VSQVRIIPLDTTQNADKTAIGPKALSLIRLGPATAFREHLEQNKLLTRIKASTDKLKKTEPQAKEGLLSALRQAIVEAPLAKSIRHEIEKNYRKLGAEYVAVRSSGTAEERKKRFRSSNNKYGRNSPIAH